MGIFLFFLSFPYFSASSASFFHPLSSPSTPSLFLSVTPILSFYAPPISYRFEQMGKGGGSYWIGAIEVRSEQIFFYEVELGQLNLFELEYALLTTSSFGFCVYYSSLRQAYRLC